jgi:hypothetical protein
MLHVFVLVSSDILKTKILSKSDKYKEENITSIHNDRDYKNITELVAYDYDCKW